MEYFPYFGFDLNNGKINVQGEGNSQMSTTSINDVARFAVHVLTTLPREQLENVSFHIEGDRIVSIVSHLPLIKSLMRPTRSPTDDE
jgi:hypothetical protein